MITQRQYQIAREKARALLDRVGVVLTRAEHEQFEVADFGLGELEKGCN